MRLAIIDDHELVREGLRELIHSRGNSTYDVAYAGGSLVEALTFDLDIALLDVELGPGAPDVAANCRDLISAGVATLLMSAYDDPVAVRSGLAAGALGFVPKRVSFEELEAALLSVAADEMHLSVDLASILASGSEVPDLSPRELDALQLYASGLKIAAVARRMDVSPHTVKEYLDRVRAKYQRVGRPARTRTELYAQASRDGLLKAHESRS
jgi:DNA-binding NarL/FixJ family response regulator